MKRGLVLPDQARIPSAEHVARLDAIQTQLRAEGMPYALIYGDVAHSDDIAYLTNLCIYWNEGILAVPAHGEPAFLTKLSQRVHPWIRRTSTLADVRSGRDLAELSAEFVDGGDPVGIVDYQWWPAWLLHHLEAALPGARLVALPERVRDARLAPSTRELALLREGGGILADALAGAVGQARGSADCVARVERLTRGAGFTDVFTSSGAAADGSVSLEVTGQFHALWLRAARAAGETGETVSAALDAAVSRSLRPGARRADLARAVEMATDGPLSLSIGCVHHADLATGGDYHFGDQDGPFRAGQIVAVTVATDSSAGRIAVADTYRLTDAGVEVLTGLSREGDQHGHEE